MGICKECAHLGNRGNCWFPVMFTGCDSFEVKAPLSAKETVELLEAIPTKNPFVVMPFGFPPMGINDV